jgi:hypothetical protein
VSAKSLTHTAGSWLVPALVSVLAAALLVPAEAGAKRGIETGIAVPESLSADPGVRDLWLGRTVGANADLVRVDVIWRGVAGPQPPANPGDPNDPAYDFSRLDAAVRGAQQRGLQVLFTVFRAPDWAEGTGRPAGLPAGSWKPDPARFAQFGSALARRYSGSFSPASGVPPLPRVRYFEAWNEPNLTDFFAPQRAGDQVVSPDAYRTLLNSFYDAVHAVDPRNVVISGGTGAYGDPPGGERTRPVAFLRQLFCLEGRKQLEPQPCPETRMDAFGHHPFGHPSPPTHSTVNPDDAGIPDIGRLERVLRAADRAGVVRPGGKRPIWVTEFWWITRPPPNPDAVANEPQQARYVEQALYLFWKQGVSMAIHYLIRDPGVPFNTGLFFSGGEQKLSFKAFRFPFVTDRLGGKRVLAWGKSPKAGNVKVQAKKRGKWRTVKRTRVGKNGVFTARVRGSNNMRARIGPAKSLVWR